MKKCEHFLLSRTGDAFGRRNKKSPTNYDSICAPFRKEFSKHFVRITITLGAPAYGISFHMKEQSKNFLL